MLKELIIFMFYPSRFTEIAAAHAIKEELKTNIQLQKEFPDGQLPPERRKPFEKNALEATNKIRDSYKLGN